MKLKPKQPGACFPGHNRSRLEGAAVSSLTFRAGDPKRFKERDIEIAAAVLAKLPTGAPLPLVVNDKGEIILGHIFVHAARKRGMEWITVIRHEGMSEIEEKQYAIAIDQLLGKGSWDPVDLGAWIRDFEEGLEDFNHLSIGLDNGELDRALAFPKSIIQQLDASAPIPALPPQIQPGTPANLLRRRPDVAAAEFRLHAATARVGVATADLFPRLSLGAALGTYSFAFDNLLSPSRSTNSAILGIDWSFLDIGRVRARIAEGNAEADGLLSHYQATVLSALEDTENSLVRFSRGRQEFAKLIDAEAQADKAAGLAKRRYEAGAIDLFEYLDVQRSQLQAQDARADGQARATIAAVSLYAALAGGWPQYPVGPVRKSEN